MGWKQWLGMKGKKEYAQKGSWAKTQGRAGSGLLDEAVGAARKRNAALAKAAGEDVCPECGNTKGSCTCGK